MGARVRVGTASWTDETLVKSGRFYPPEAKNPEDRLRFYATQFDLVEVDSSYYAIPGERTAAWVERTPADFTFDVKAFALLTGHPAAPRALPRDLREALPEAVRAKKGVYPRDLPGDVLGELWARFASALLPLDSAGKLGAVLFQFPPWFSPGHQSLAELRALRARLPQYDIAVEFRSPRWLDESHADRTLDLLRAHDYVYVAVDEPQGTPRSVPPFYATTNDRLAIVRFHGRNVTDWARRGASVGEKYDYLYAEAELREWAPRARELADQAAEVHLVFNNCHEDKAVRNARQMAMLLDVGPSA